MRKFVYALLTVILFGSLFTRVVFADDEPKAVPAGDDHPKKVGAAKAETTEQSDAAGAETSAPQDPKIVQDGKGVSNLKEKVSMLTPRMFCYLS